MMTVNNQLKLLTQLAHIDSHFAAEEKDLLYKIGKANKLIDSEIKDIVENPDQAADLSHLTNDDKFELLVNMMKLIKADRKIYKSEIRFCQQIARTIGYKKSVVSKIFQRVYGDPEVNSDIEEFKPAIQKYLIQK